MARPYQASGYCDSALAAPPGEPEVGAALVRALKALGYRYVTLDLEGYRTGSLNEGLLLNLVS